MSMIVGVGKGLVGLIIRPGIGAMEWSAKSAAGAGLVCLGREGISGTVQRRVRAPGASVDDALEVGS